MIKRKKWLEKEITFLKENYKIMFYSDIAKTLNRTLESTKHKIKRLKLKSGLRSRGGLNQVRSNNYNWKGGMSKDNYRYKKRYVEKYPEKDKAGRLLRRAVKKGQIIKPKKCEECKKEKKLEGHHKDYTKPLEVKWFCRKCHNKTKFTKTNNL